MNIINFFMKKKCESCSHWSKEDKYNGGYCRNTKLTEDYGDEAYLSDALVYSYNESGEFWTGKDFCCTHHKQESEK